MTWASAESQCTPTNVERGDAGAGVDERDGEREQGPADAARVRRAKAARDAHVVDHAGGQDADADRIVEQSELGENASEHRERGCTVSAVLARRTY